MAAISIVSGTSLNAFFHPCENLQSIAIQHTWRSASSQLLSCIAKTELCYQRGREWGQANVLSCHWDGQRWDKGWPWGGRLIPAVDEGTSCALHPWPPTGTHSAAEVTAAVRKISRALAQQPNLLKIYCYPNCVMAGFPLLPDEEWGRLTKSLDILGISGFIISVNVWIGVLGDASPESKNGGMLSWECLSNGVCWKILFWEWLNPCRKFCWIWLIILIDEG